MATMAKNLVLAIALIAASGLSPTSSSNVETPATQTMDVLEGENVLLECRFPPSKVDTSRATLYWIRSNRDGHDNAAIGDSSLDEAYSVELDREKGHYDLRLLNATYDRDNGDFVCHIKSKTGDEDLSKSLAVTVLLKPSPPTIVKSSPHATEGRQLNLTCSSVGGSPPPQISWYSGSASQLLEARLIKGKNKDSPTVSVLSIMPTKENDGSTYRCSVWNRALGQRQKLETMTKIDVNYFPRVTVQTPLKVMKDDTAQLHCSVDSKPKVNTVKWTRNGRYIDTNFIHTIPRVGLDDDGAYTCSADNNLGQVGKAELTLEVLHEPIVTLPHRREVKEGERLVEVKCQIKANPWPFRVEWFKEDDPDFHQTGSTLRLSGITADHNGRYVCSATNSLAPTAGPKLTKSGNATIAINVRHAPGRGSVSPTGPVAIEGRSAVLTCASDPPGYPEPTFEWWKGARDSRAKKILAVSREYAIDTVRLDSAGEYHCQARNELGQGTVGSAHLDVFQAPEIVTGLQTSIVKRSGEENFQVSCVAEGKPAPSVTWQKNGRKIMAADSNVYQVRNEEQELEQRLSFRVVSTLKFIGPDRIEGRQLMPQDRAHYTCQFENEVKHATAESTMLLRIEHSPVVVHQHNKVAYDKGQTARITCRMQAYPKPRFDWSFANSVLQNQPNRGPYAMNSTALGDDVYESVLTIYNIDHSSYGDYTCKSVNAIGPKRTIVRLQQRSKPDRPSNVRPLFTSYNLVTLGWDDGFDGGYNSTKFTVEYRRQGESLPRYTDCKTSNPCNVSGLEQHTQYYVRVKASNIRGESKFSPEVAVATKVDAAMIPAPANVHYEKSTRRASSTVDDTPLHLTAKIELENDDGTWRHYDSVRMERDQRFFEKPVMETVGGNLRVRFCLQTNELMCGPYTEALIVDVRPNAATAAAAFAQPWLIAIVVVVVVLSLTAVLAFVRCCCCGGRMAKAKALKTEGRTEGQRPTIIHGTGAAAVAQPPPYTTASNYSGIENKGVDSAKDLSDDNLKANGLFQPAQPTNSYPFASSGEPTSNNSNSANGGSVNSQDSLWNVKNSNGVQIPADVMQQQQQQYSLHHHHHQINHQNNGYMAYDPLAMQQQQTQTTANPGLFSGSEDYTHYPYPDEYMSSMQYLQPRAGSQPPRQTDYPSFGDVSGLPDPYSAALQQNDGQQQQQQQQVATAQQHLMSMGQQQQQLEDSSAGETNGYSTPSAKNRRIIREIIV